MIPCESCFGRDASGPRLSPYVLCVGVPCSLTIKQSLVSKGATTWNMSWSSDRTPGEVMLTGTGIFLKTAVVRTHKIKHYFCDLSVVLQTTRKKTRLTFHYKCFLFFLCCLLRNSSQLVINQFIFTSCKLRNFCHSPITCGRSAGNFGKKAQGETVLVHVSTSLALCTVDAVGIYRLVLW